MKLGYANPGYPVIRTILDKCKGLTYTRVRPYSSICSNVASKIHLSALRLVIIQSIMARN